MTFPVLKTKSLTVYKQFRSLFFQDQFIFKVTYMCIFNEHFHWYSEFNLHWLSIKWLNYTLPLILHYNWVQVICQNPRKASLLSAVCSHSVRSLVHAYTLDTHYLTSRGSVYSSHPTLQRPEQVMDSQEFSKMS